MPFLGLPLIKKHCLFSLTNSTDYQTPNHSQNSPCQGLSPYPPSYLPTGSSGAAFSCRLKEQGLGHLLQSYQYINTRPA